MAMNTLILQLQSNGQVIVSLARSVDDEEARWKPESGAWTIIEIINHLADEETDDFRTRLRLTLDDPAQPWPPIDPEGAGVERRYSDRDLEESINRFAHERERSLAWLRTLPPREDARWMNAFQHPSLGELTAGDLLASWAAHDLLHLRQLVKRRYEHLQAHASPFDIGYAGKW